MLIKWVRVHRNMRSVVFGFVRIVVVFKIEPILINQRGIYIRIWPDQFQWFIWYLFNILLLRLISPFDIQEFILTFIQIRCKAVLRYKWSYTLKSIVWILDIISGLEVSFCWEMITCIIVEIIKLAFWPWISTRIIYYLFCLCKEKLLIGHLKFIWRYCVLTSYLFANW